MDIREIPNEPGYGVTPDGRVWSCRGGEWKALALSVNGKWGYLKVKLNGGKTHKVHVLMALVFIGPRPEGLTIDHVDGVKAHNQATNLEYITYEEQMRRAHRLGLVAPPTPKPKLFKRMAGDQHALPLHRRRGAETATAKLTETDVVQIRKLREHGESLREIGKRFGVSYTQVDRIVSRQKWAHVA